MCQHSFPLSPPCPVSTSSFLEEDGEVLTLEAVENLVQGEATEPEKEEEDEEGRRAGIVVGIPIGPL